MSQEEVNPLSLTAYWNRTNETVFSNPRRRTVLETILEGNEDVYTTTALADLTANRLVEDGEIEDPSDWAREDLSPLLPYIEDTGIIQRLPKPEREDQFYSVRNNYVSQWLEDQDFDSDAPRYLPQGRAACIIHYLGTEFQRDDMPTPTASLFKNESGDKTASLLPIEALLYAQIEQVADITDPEVDIAIADLDFIRGTKYHELLTDKLDLRITLPGPDDSYNDHTRTHEFTICGFIEGIYRYDSETDIETKLQTQIATMAATAQQMYTTSRKSNSDERGRLSVSTLDVNEIVQRDSVDGALNKFGYDVVFDETIGCAWFGIYTRKQYPKQSQID